MIIWRGYGWVVPLIFFAFFLCMNVLVDSVSGSETYYQDNDWPRALGLLLGAVAVGGLGFLVNHKRRVVYVDEVTGEVAKAKSHSLFFVPIEYWTMLGPLLVGIAFYYDGQSDEQDLIYIAAPAVGDVYTVKLTEVFELEDDGYPYGVLVVHGFDAATVTMDWVPLRFTGLSGSRRDKSLQRLIDDYETSYSLQGESIGELLLFEYGQLRELKSGNAIVRIDR